MASLDEPLLRELYETYAHKVYGRCRYLLKDDEEARDAMHDVFIKVQKNLDRFRGESSPLTWMTRIATNHCLNILRAKKAAWHKKYREEVKTHVAASDGGMGKEETKQLFELCVKSCDPEIAEAAIYYFVDEMTQAEVSTLMGISAPTLRKRLRQFIAASRDALAEAVPGIEFLEAPI